MTSTHHLPPGDQADRWITCTCCARSYPERAPGHAPFCATDFVDGTATANFGSMFQGAAVFAEHAPAQLELNDGTLCDLCLEALLSSGALVRL